MNEFVIREIADLSGGLAVRHFPLARAHALQDSFSRLISRHIGGMRSGQRFESEALLVTGSSGTGKSKEIGDLLTRFNGSCALLPSGIPAKFITCVLSSKGTWKDLGKHTLHAMGYPINERARRTQTEIWDLVTTQAKLQGCIGIHYDEAQHILRDKGRSEVLTILDAFKSLIKGRDWPLMLILSGVPELANYVREEPQLFRLVTRVRFEDIDLNPRDDGDLGDYLVLNEIVGSYALKLGVEVAEDLRGTDFLHRLATAAAFRWGIAIEMVIAALAHTTERGLPALTREAFDAVWAAKTGIAEIASPFSNTAYRTVYRREDLFESQF